ncbi:fibronectin type III-like domain-contianing protein [Niveispirillum sp. KHB5.9]|uniref:fibronectin type III-like domain-contianing protein n=1 Tax=Niveispirillum sp. KHB5.9 TaxID=3400269 RepID=UPI003A857531
MSRDRITAGEGVELSMKVRNSGRWAGDEVVQLYVSHLTRYAQLRALAGFQRLTLKPGESRTLRFTLDAKALSIVAADGKRVVPEGAVRIWVGGGQPLHRAGLPVVAGQSVGLIIEGNKQLSDF